METNHSNIGGHVADKHLAQLSKMIVDAAATKGENMFSPKPNPDRNPR